MRSLISTFSLSLVLPILTAALYPAGNPPLSRTLLRRSVQAARSASPLTPRDRLLAKREQSSPVNTTSQRFQNERAQAFHVNGTAGAIPDVNFDVGDSWAGRLPIAATEEAAGGRELFFWFWPSLAEEGENELIIWLTGGPGCSSLNGLLFENGPISWRPGQARPTPDPYSWNHAVNVLYIDQPVGTGFSKGTSNVTNELESSAQLFGFVQQFLEVFDELKGADLYITGESYAGSYIPYLASHIFGHKSELDLNLKGTYLIDAVLSSFLFSRDVATYPFVERWRNVLNLNASFMAELEQAHNDCGYQAYLDKYLTYPPPAGPFPYLNSSGPDGPTPECDLFTKVYTAAPEINSGFNIYNVLRQAPIPWDVLGFDLEARQSPPNSAADPVYFKRPEVQAALHVEPYVNWTLCPDGTEVFVGQGGTVSPNDTSPASGETVLPGVIENSLSGDGQRTVIVHGQLDYVLVDIGSELAIQNMTWSGAQGFQFKPNESFYVEGQGSMGTQHTERDLTYVSLALSGHEVPQYQPAAAYKLLEYLLGRIDTLGPLDGPK